MATKNKHRSGSSPAAAPKAEAVKSTFKTSTKAFSQEFNPDYTYVKQDLKRIGLLAGSFFVILIVLSFFLR